LGRGLLDADANVQDMLQGVFPHDLFQGERIGTREVEFGQVLDLDPVFIDIVHTTAGPAFLVVCQGEVVPSASDRAVARLPNAAPDPDIVEVISVGMAQDEVDIIAVGGIFPADIKVEGGVIAALPLLAGKGNIFLEDIGGEGAGGPRKTSGGDQKRDDQATNDPKTNAIFQGIEIYIKVASYNTFRTCSFAFSSSSFISTTHCWIVES
jgi:hypothetical protein